MMPRAKDAYRTFAIHLLIRKQAIVGDESWETETFRLAEYTKEKRDKLYQEFDRVAKAPAEIEAACTDGLLMKELKPWLTEFAKLGERGKKAIELMDLYRSGDNLKFWSQYVKSRYDHGR